MPNHSESEEALNDHADRVLGPEGTKAPTVVSVAPVDPTPKLEDSQRSFDELVSEKLAPEWRVSVRRVGPYRWPEKDGTCLIVGEIARWPVERVEMLRWKIIDTFGGGRYKLVLYDSWGNICRTTEIIVPPEEFTPKGISVLEGKAVDEVGRPPQSATVFGRDVPVQKIPVCHPSSPSYRPMGEFKSSLTLDQILRQNERLIDALLRTNHNLMQMCERLVRSGPSDDILDPFEEIERLQRQVERVKQKRDDEERGKKRHVGK
jgi:hypothetical protein